MEDNMFETEKEYAQAMLNGRVFDINGNICKFDPDADVNGYSEYGTEGEYSPFVCKRKHRDYWEFMDELWYERQGIKEVFPDLPNLKVNTKVLVRDDPHAPFVERFFKEFVKNPFIATKFDEDDYGYDGNDDKFDGGFDGALNMDETLMFCFENGTNSDTSPSGVGIPWKYWEVVDGIYKGSCRK